MVKIKSSRSFIWHNYVVPEIMPLGTMPFVIAVSVASVLKIKLVVFYLYNPYFEDTI